MLLDTDTFTYGSFCAQTFLHMEAFTLRHIYTQKLLHTHTPFYTQTLLHTDAFTHRSFYTQTLLHTDAFTHRRFYTQRLLHTNTFTHKHFYTQTLLHADACTHRSFYTQTLLRRNTFTHRRFYTQTVLHTSAFTHNHLYTQTLLHTGRPMYSQRSHRCRGHLSNPTGGWSLCHILGGHAFNVVQATEVCWDSSGSHTSSKVENQIVKLLTKVLSQAKNRLGPRQGGGTILSLQSIIGAGHNCIRIIKVWS